MTCDSNHQPGFQVSLTVNDCEIELNDFVQNFLSRTVVGMLKSLRGVGDVQSANLMISKPADISPEQEC